MIVETYIKVNNKRKKNRFQKDQKTLKSLNRAYFNLITEDKRVSKEIEKVTAKIKKILNRREKEKKKPSL